MKRFVWFIPHVNGVVIGVMLLACNGFEVSKVVGAWLFIGAVLVLYSLALRGLPIIHEQEEPKRTVVQEHYLHAFHLRPGKGV